MQGKLYLCATPIGNLDDITLRVLNTLKEVDLIAAEDTRHSIKLLNHFDIKTPMTSYHEFNKVEKARVLVEKMKEVIDLPVSYWDERLSTVMAERQLIAADVSRKKRKSVIDKMAAVVILQGYLDRLQFNK